MEIKEFYAFTVHASKIETAFLFRYKYSELNFHTYVHNLFQVDQNYWVHSGKCQYIVTTASNAVKINSDINIQNDRTSIHNLYVSALKVKST